MKIRSQKGLKYELGVMLFNVTQATFSNDYDAIGNFNAIVTTLEGVELEELKEGFMTECENYDMSEQESEKLFKDAMEQVE